MNEPNLPINIPGSYPAKLIDWAITETKAGDPQVACMFSYVQDGKPLTLTWYGSFKEKAVQRTLDTIKMLGLKGTDLSILADGCQGKGLDLSKSVEIVVEVNADMLGRQRAQIKWVNDPTRSAQTIRKVDREKAKSLLEVHSLKLSGMVGVSVTPKAAIPLVEPFLEQDLGF